MSLLTQAKNAAVKKPRERLKYNRAELAVAWALGEVSGMQVGIALGLASSNQIYVQMAGGLKDAIQLGLLKVGTR